MESFFDLLDDCICMLDEKMGVTFFNKVAWKRLGYGQEESKGKNITELVYVDASEGSLLVKGLHADGSVIEGLIESCCVKGLKDEGICGRIRWKESGESDVGEEVLRKLIDYVTEDVCIKDEEGRYVFVNESYAANSNYTKSEMIGKSTENFFHGEQVVRLLAQDKEVRLKQQLRVVVIENEDKEKNYEYIKFPVFDDKKGIKYIGVIRRNMSIYKSMYDQLVESNQEIDDVGNLECMSGKKHEKKDMLYVLEPIIKDTFKANAINMWIYDSGRNELSPYFATERSERWLETKGNVVISREEIDYYAERQYGRANIVELEGEEDYYVHYGLMCRGEFFGVLTMGYEEYPKDAVLRNHLIHIICNQLALIIRNSRLSDKILEEFKGRLEVEEELKKFLAISTDIMVEIDENGYYKKVSSGCIHLLGWTEEEFLKKRWIDLLHPDEVDFVEKVVDERNGDRLRMSFANRYQCADGTYKWLRWNGWDKKGKNIIGTAKDVTYEKGLQEREEDARKIMQLEQVRTKFFANLSHEFKTPLTIIMSAIQMINTDFIEVDLKENLNLDTYLKMIKQNSYRLLRLVNNLIDVTKIDAGYYQLDLGNYNIVSVVENLVLSVAEYARNKCIEITFDTEVEEEIIACDADKIERIILNLLSNAIKYTSADGSIWVDIKLENEYVLIEVKDTGKGIPDDKIEFIFERFLQVDELLTRSCEGSGIGLSLVKELVEMHQGMVSVISREGEGSTFKVRLPRVTMNGGNKIDDSDDLNARLEKCSIEFADIYIM